MQRLWWVLLTDLLQGVAQIAFLYNSEHQGGPAHNGIGFSTSATDLENTLKAFLSFYIFSMELPPSHMTIACALLP